MVKFQVRLSFSKLDRFLISVEWDDLFLLSVVHALPKPRSDHIPILLKGEEEIN